MLYLRKINLEAWDGKPKDDSDSISDLATSNHELSVWEVNDDLSDIQDIALAVALTRDKVEGIAGVIIDPTRINESEGWDIPVMPQLGNSAYRKRIESHKNFIVKNISEMKWLAFYIHSLIEEGNKSFLFYFDELSLLESLKLKLGKDIQLEDLNDKGRWKKAIKKII